MMCKSRVLSLLSHGKNSLLSRLFLSSSTTREEGCPKDFASSEVIPIEYWRKLIWLAIDLKKTLRENNKNCLGLLQSKHVTVLFYKPNGVFQVAFSLACDLLGVRKTLYNDFNFDYLSHPHDTSKVFSKLTDLLIAFDLPHFIFKKLSTFATIPLFPASTNKYNFQRGLSDMMTIFNHVNRLKGLTLTWIGPPSPTFNAYLVLSSGFGINMNYFCLCKYGSGRVSPVMFDGKTKNWYIFKETVVKECETLEEALTGTQIVITSPHPQENVQLNLEMMEKADSNWFFLSTLPRTKTEVADNMFHHEKNLVWESYENYLYVAMAIILSTLKSDFRPSSSMPNFDGPEENQSEAS